MILKISDFKLLKLTILKHKKTLLIICQVHKYETDKEIFLNTNVGNFESNSYESQ